MANQNQYQNPMYELIDAIRYGSQRISAAVKQEKTKLLPLKGTVLVSDGAIVDVLGIPPYVDDISRYSAWGITKTGWYAFARIASVGGTTVTAQTTIIGADGYIATIGSTYIDVAVWFSVAAQSKEITIDWGPYTHTFIFKATDLAVRNLDYRTTYYVYDLAPFAAWAYGLTTDAAFVEGKTYYTEAEGVYTPATVTAGDPVPPVYFTHAYVLTEDETFQTGKTYYTESEGEYTAATVTAGEAVTPETYYESVYTLADDETFQEGTAYYAYAGGAYTLAADVTPGDPVPQARYYVHTKVTFAGMTRNVTYRLDAMIDCPVEIVLPAIQDDGYGAWFEMQLIQSGDAYSLTLVPPEGVKVASNTLVNLTKGVNVVDLQYSDIGSVQVWRALNTHSNYAEDVPALVSIAFRKAPDTVSYAVGDALNLTGAEVVATFADGHTKLVTAGCTFTPASGAALTAEDDTLTASYTVGDVTATATVELTITEG